MLMDMEKGKGKNEKGKLITESGLEIFLKIEQLTGQNCHIIKQFKIVQYFKIIFLIVLFGINLQERLSMALNDLNLIKDSQSNKINRFLDG